MAEQRTKKDNTIAIIVILAGLLTGGVLTYVFLQPKDPPRYTPEYPVAQSQRIPFGSAEDAPVLDGAPDIAVPEDTQAAADASDGPASAGAAQPGMAAGDASEIAEASAADNATIEGAHRHMDAEGVTEYAQLTEELFIRVSAKMVIDAAVLSQAVDEDVDPSDVQHILAEKAGEHLAEARVDPEAFWEYTRDVHSDPERAAEMGEKILREAEKHTQRTITIEDVPGMTPTPVPGAPTQ